MFLLDDCSLGDTTPTPKGHGFFVGELKEDGGSLDVELEGLGFSGGKALIFGNENTWFVRGSFDSFLAAMGGVGGFEKTAFIREISCGLSLSFSMDDWSFMAFVLSPVL